MVLLGCLRCIQPVTRLILNRSSNCAHRFRKLGPLHQSFRSASWYNKFLSRNNPNQLKEVDNIPERFILIYRNKMSSYLFGAQLVAVLSGITVIGVLCSRSDFTKTGEIVRWSKVATSTKGEEIVYITILTCLVILVQMLVAKTPVRIYRNPGTRNYISVNYGGYMCTKFKIEFLMGELRRAPGSSLLPWLQERYLLETKSEIRSMFLLDYYFRRPADLSIMIGEQKDPDMEKDKS